MVVIGNDWDEVIGEEFSKDYYLKLREFLKSEYSQNTIYPDMYHIFSALKLTPYHSVKVAIFGQDPYHEPNQAHGLCFSVQDGTALPPSLKNIYKELQDDLGIPPAQTGDLTSWAEQGVLLLNAVLTVRRGQANSHKGKGWEILTDEIIRKLNEREAPIVFILWGANARSKKALITNPQHLIIESAHPSPLSAFAGFFGSRPFSRTNQFLAENGEAPINWEVGGKVQGK